jgi:preprotein translocase subunit SecE
VYAFFQELFQTGLYKRNQGRIARQVTFFVVLLVVAAGVFRMSQILPSQLGHALGYGLPCVLAFLGSWAAYRLVNVPIFADFLIAVEAEMRKVSWPTWAELYRGSIVVLVTIFALAAILFFFDFAWNLIFKELGVLPKID